MLERTPRLERRRPDLQEGVVLLSPAEPREVKQDSRLFYLAWSIPAQSSESIGTVEDQAVNPFGVTRGVFDCDRTAPACRQYVKALEAGGFNDTFEITKPVVE